MFLSCLPCNQTNFASITVIDSELEQVLQSILTETDTVNVEFVTENDGNQKVLTMTTTSTLTGLVEEQPGEEEEEDSGNNNGDDNEDPIPNPPEDPEPPPEYPEPPIEDLPSPPPFG